jgi:hypothetical protein
VQPVVDAISCHSGTQVARNSKSNDRFTKVSDAGIGGRAITNAAKLAPKRWDAIVERETGLPKPPSGKLAVLNLRSLDRCPVIIAAPESLNPPDNDNSAGV